MTGEGSAGDGSLYSEGQCIMGNDHIGPPLPPSPPVDRHTSMKTLPSRNFVGGWINHRQKFIHGNDLSEIKSVTNLREIKQRCLAEDTDSIN